MKTNPFISSPIAKILVYANLFVAICSAAQVLVTYMLFSIPINFQNNSFILFVFLSTYLQYNMQRGYLVQNTNLHTESAQWLTKHKKIIMYTVGASLIVVLFLCNSLSYTSIAIMVGAEAISTFYYLPPFNLRKHGYIKPLIIAAIWAISCAAVPLIENQLLTPDRTLFLVAQFCFIAILCILFDIKDMTDDFLNGINTYANKLGVAGTKWVCALFILASGICFYFSIHNSKALIGELIVLAVTTITVLITNEKKHRFYYYLWVDGLMALQAVVFYILLL